MFIAKSIDKFIKTTYKTHTQKMYGGMRNAKPNKLKHFLLKVIIEMKTTVHYVETTTE